MIASPRRKEMIQEQYMDFAAYLEHGIQAIENTGITILECRDRYVKIKLPLFGNTNHLGMMYGGSLCILGEVSGGAISGVSFGVTDYVPIIKEIKVRFTRPAVSDVVLEASLSEDTVKECLGKIAEKGKADFALTLELRDVADAVVARVDGLYQVRPLPPGMPNPVVGFAAKLKG
ncbi:MAG: DUF4442 domain-containing protein [Spirochaetes bacterium]|nr:MAG: DUF4442 domain-containing protein [Spirochaetota bacterium]